MPHQFRSQRVARRAAKEADDLELAALRAGYGISIPVDEALYDDNLSEEVAEQDINNDIATDPDQGPDAIAAAVLEDAQVESTLAFIDLAIQARRDVLGCLYPFSNDGRTLTYRGSRTLAYELCLSITHVENISFRPYKPLQAAFERIAAIAMGAAIGEAEFLRVGYPKDPGVADEPSSIYESVAILAARMPDPWQVDPNSEIASPNDGGVDAVVFRAFDNRPGSLIFVGNCGCGKNWLKENKHMERPSERLRDILSLPKGCNMIDFFALPFHVIDQGDWRAAYREGRIFLDRLRIAKIIEARALDGTFSLDRDLRRPIVELIQLCDTGLKPRVIPSAPDAA